MEKMVGDFNDIVAYKSGNLREGKYLPSGFDKTSLEIGPLGIFSQKDFSLDDAKLFLQSAEDALYLIRQKESKNSQASQTSGLEDSRFSNDNKSKKVYQEISSGIRKNLQKNKNVLPWGLDRADVSGGYSGLVMIKGGLEGHMRTFSEESSYRPQRSFYDPFAGLPEKDTTALLAIITTAVNALKQDGELRKKEMELMRKSMDAINKNNNQPTGSISASGGYVE
jgi:hypothetical protein